MTDGFISWTTQHSAFGTWLDPNADCDKVLKEEKQWKKKSRDGIQIQSNIKCEEATQKNHQKKDLKINR